MNYIETKDIVSGKQVKLCYTDSGKGKPVVFIHGWPLSQEMWEYQINGLADKGIRCITYDRRGFGRSSKPWSNYSYDTLTDDLQCLLEEMDLDNVTLVGFSMGCGEVLRYFTRYKGERVSKVVLISSVTPYLQKSENNPDGVDPEIFEEMISNIRQDRPAFLEEWTEHFYGVTLINHPVSAAYLDYTRMLATLASPYATQECINTFAKTDFRREMSLINVPVLLIHGESDNIVPIESSAEPTSNAIPDCKYLIYPDAPHGLFFTEKERLNYDLYNFIMSEEIFKLDERYTEHTFPGVV